MTNQGGTVQLVWPGNAPSLVVDQTDTLEGGNTTWAPLSDTPTLQDGMWILQKPIDTDRRFYRLRLKTTPAN